MKAVIFAAGRGNGLYLYTKHTPKCLLDIGSETILEHQNNHFRARFNSSKFIEKSHVERILRVIEINP